MLASLQGREVERFKKGQAERHFAHLLDRLDAVVDCKALMVFRHATAREVVIGRTLL